MPVTTNHGPAAAERAARPQPDIDDPRWAGTPLARPHWLESPSGFPAGSVGEAGPGSAADIVATARERTLSRRQVDEVVAFTEFLAGRAVPDTDREDLLDDLVDAFEDSPVSTANFLRPLAGGVHTVAALSPVERASRRLQALTTTWTIEQRRRADGHELNPVLEVVSRYNPLLRHWASTGVVLVADTLTARAEQHRLVLSLLGRDGEPAAALTDRLLARCADAGHLERAELAASQLRLLCTRAWLRDLGDTALQTLRAELEPAVASALDVDIVVQQVGFRAAMAVGSALAGDARPRDRRPAARAARRQVVTTTPGGLSRGVSAGL